MEYRFGTRREQQKQRKDKIGGEAVHLAHGAQQPFPVILKTAEHGQERRRQYLRYRLYAHLAPFVGLRVASEFGKVVVSTDDKRVGVERQCVEK